MQHQLDRQGLDTPAERRERRPPPGKLLAAVAGMLLVGAGAAGAATPIPSGAPTSLPTYTGAPATRQAIRARRPPQNPHLARNPRSNVHNDSWMTDSYWVNRGPLGRSPETRSVLLNRVCVTVTFDRRDRVVATCSSLTGPVLFMFHPRTLEVLAEFDLPFVFPPPGTDPTQNTAGGAYFFLDDQDRATVATATKHIMIIRETPHEPGFALDHDYDVSAAVPDDRITSVLPDWEGRLWFVGRYHGSVNVLDPATGVVRQIRLDEEIENSFAVDADGIYIVSDRSMYRFGLDDTGTPAVVWSAPYQNVGIQKPGQFNAGSGTTPTLLHGGYVAIADNADPMNVVVYRTAATLPSDVPRMVCEVPVFGAGAGATENSLIGAGSSLIVENNYGYHLGTAVNGGVTTPGIARVDVDPDASGCHVVWTNTTERAPSVVPKLSLESGLIYVYTKDPDPVNTTADAWFWTALDFRTGALVWKQLAGTGVSYNNHYAGIAIGPGNRAYLGVIGGLIALHDMR